MIVTLKSLKCDKYLFSRKQPSLCIYILGGSHLYSSDKAQNNGLIDAFGALASGNTDISQQSLQVRVPTPQVFVFAFNHNEEK